MAPTHSRLGIRSDSPTMLGRRDCHNSTYLAISNSYHFAFFPLSLSIHAVLDFLFLSKHNKVLTHLLVCYTSILWTRVHVWSRANTSQGVRPNNRKKKISIQILNFQMYSCLKIYLPGTLTVMEGHPSCDDHDCDGWKLSFSNPHSQWSFSLYKTTLSPDLSEMHSLGRKDLRRTNKRENKSTNAWW